MMKGFDLLKKVIKKSNNEINWILKKLFHYSEDIPTVYLPGFPANYKDHDFLLESLAFVNGRVRLVIAGRGWSRKLGFTFKTIRNVEIFVVDKYLDSKEYKFLSSYSSFGIFPYSQPPGDEIFQGSGTIPNFIYEGKACIGLDEASIPEYINNGGIITPAGDSKQFSESIDSMLSPGVRQKYEANLFSWRNRFSIETHAKQVTSLINLTINQPRFDWG